MPEGVPKGLAHRIRELALPLREELRTDADLLTAFVENRDEDAFATLVLRYRQAVWDTSRLRLGNDADAEDVFQAVFIALARDARKVNPGTLEGWLRTVAVRVSTNVLIAARRRKNAHKRLWTRVVPGAEAVPPDGDLCEIVREELAGLSDRFQVVLSLYYLEGKTQLEIGGILGLTDRAVAARLRRGLDSLRGRLARRGTMISAAALAVILGSVAIGAAEAAIPIGLTATTTATALAAVDGGQPATVAAQLAAGLTRASDGPRLKLCVLVLAACGLGVIGGSAVLTDRPPVKADSPAPKTPAAESPRVDRLGDVLPVGSVTRIGTHRFRTTQYPGAEDVTFLPGGKWVASVHGGTEVTLWESATGKLIRTFEGPPGARWVVTDPAGRRLAVAGVAEVWVWELGVDAPRLAWKWRANQVPPQPAVAALAFSPDGSLVAVGDREEKCTRLFGVATGTEVETLPGQPLAVTAAGGKYLAVIGGRDRNAWANRLVFWDAHARRAACVLDAPAGEIFVDVAQSADGTAAVRTVRGAVRLIDIATGRETGNWSSRDGVRRGFAFLPGGKELVEVEDRRVRFRVPATGAESRPATVIPALVFHSLNHNFDVAKQLSPDGKYVATSSLGEVTLWDLATGRPDGPQGQVQGGIRALAFSPDGRSVLTFADRASEVCVWDAETGEPGRSLTAPPGTGFVGLGWGPDVRPLTLYRPPAPPHVGGLLRSDPRTGVEVERFALPRGQTWVSGSTGQLAPFAITPSGTRAAVASDTTVDVMEPTGACVRRISTDASVAWLTLSADGRTLAAVTHTWLPRSPGSGPRPPQVGFELWDVATGRQRSTPAMGKTWDLFQVSPALSADGRWVAAVTWDRAIALTEIASGRTGQQFEIPSRPLALAFSPDGRLLAAGDAAGAVTVWDLAAGRVARRFTGHRGPISVLAFAPNGRRLASGSTDGTALVWDTTELRVTVGAQRSADELRNAILSANAADAHRASFALAERPEDAVRLLAPELAPAPAAADIARWVDELGAEDLATQERAQVILEKAGETAEPALHRRLADGPPAELRPRIERLLARLEFAGNPARTVAMRVVAILERTGTPASRHVLEDAARLAGPELKTEIEAALARMPGSPSRQ